MSICKLLARLDFSILGLQVLPPAENPLDHVSLLRAHFCRHQGIWVPAATLTKLQIASASKETMAAALGSSLPAPTDATTAVTTTATTTTAVAAATTIAVAAATTTTAVAAAATAEAAAAATATAAPVQDDPEDLVDAVIASALEGINLALSMDNPLGFLAMSPIFREPKIQGEPP